MSDLERRLKENLVAVILAESRGEIPGQPSRERTHAIVKTVVANTLAEDEFLAKAATLDEFERPMAPGSQVYWAGETAAKAAGAGETWAEPAGPDSFDTMGQPGGARFMTKGSRIFTESGLPLADALGAAKRERRIAAGKPANYGAVRAAQVADAVKAAGADISDSVSLADQRTVSEAVYELTTENGIIRE